MATRTYEKKPLYRKVNTKARGVHHDFGKSFNRNEKNHSEKKMVKKERGLDYTPLYKFLLTKVGENWDEVKSEAISRLDKKDPINHMVYRNKEDAQDYARVGESTYYNTLYVDKDGILRKVNPNFNETSLPPLCNCCTHTFNGKPFTKKYQKEV